MIERCEFVPEDRQCLLRLLGFESLEELLLPEDELDGLQGQRRQKSEQRL